VRLRVRSLPSLLGVLAVLVAIAITAITMVSTSASADRERLLSATDTMQSTLLRQAALVAVGRAAGVASFETLSASFNLALAEGLSATRTGSPEGTLLLEQADLASRWRVAGVEALRSPTGSYSLAAPARQQLLDSFTKDNTALRVRLLRAWTAADRRSQRTLSILAMVLAALAAGGGGILAFRRWRQYVASAVANRGMLSIERRHRTEQEEFTRALQGARTEREAQRMLKRQLERAFDCRVATVLNCNNSANRLEAVTGVCSDSPLAAAVPDAEPQDCLAVRFGQTHERAAGSAPLLMCELCGGLDGSVTCVPSLVGGEVIGSVLIESVVPLDQAGHRRLGDVFILAAPVLASMRNLRLAETRAATDVLTGLPNRRSAEETLKLMLANAERSAAPCAVAMFDLDHFKEVNDVYGHEIGDRLLGAVGAAARRILRTSDFMARFGGEEFLLVLSNTALEGALAACEKLRKEIATLRLPDVPYSPSASFGVAVFPDDAVELDALLRGADHALYAAKGSGRNCVKALGEIDLPAEVSSAYEPVILEAVE
jgi:diguanylate cyclase (GGDEF)-like protein